MRRIRIYAPDLEKNLRRLQHREEIFKQFPMEVTDQTRLIVQGPKLWQADSDQEELEWAQFEKENQLAIDAIKAKVEDPLRSI